MEAVDLGVFLLGTSAPMILMYLVAFMRRSSLTIGVFVMFICAVFGLGVAILNHVAGWIG